MKRDDRKQAVRDYRERKVSAGIFAIRCSQGDDVWVGRAPDLSTIQNRIWFTLRQGSSTCRSLQAAWTEHGADAFAFEVLEELAEEDMALARDRLLKTRLADWREELGALAI